MTFFPAIEWEPISGDLHLSDFGLEDFFSKPKDAPFWISFSGGADSVCTLFYAISIHRYFFRKTKKNRKVILFYLDHGQQNLDSGIHRPQENSLNSYSRPAILKYYQEALEREPGVILECDFIKRDIEAFARKLNTSFEYAGAKWRKRQARKMMKANENMIFFRGHTLTDWIETVVMRLNRGSMKLEPFAGFFPIPFSNHKNAYPLSNLTRKEVRDLCQEYSLPWFEDKSNDDINIRRNYVRALQLDYDPNGLRKSAKLLREKKDNERKNANEFHWECVVPFREYRTKLKGALPSYEALRPALDSVGLGPLSKSHIKIYTQTKRLAIPPFYIEIENWNKTPMLTVRRGLSFKNLKHKIPVNQGAIQLPFGRKKIKKIFSEKGLSYRQRRLVCIHRLEKNPYEVLCVDLSKVGDKKILATNNKT